MKQLTFLACLATAVLLMAPTGFAATATVGNLTFQKPGDTGYVEKPVAGGLLFQHQINRGDGRAGGVIMAIGISASPAAAFDAAFASLADGIAQMKRQKNLVEVKGVTTTGMPAHFVLRCCRGNGDSGQPMSMSLVAFQDKDTMAYGELLMINVERDEEQAYKDSFDKVVASFAFDGGPPRPVLAPAPTAGSETLTGLFLNTSTSLTPNPFGGTDFRVNMDTYFFDPSGYLADEPPVGNGGIADFCGHKPAACGTYQVNGGQVSLNTMSNRFAILKSETTAFAHDGAGLKLGDRTFNSVEPAHDLKLSGSWTYFWASSGMTATSSGGVSSSHTIVFSPDGQFRRSGFTGASVSNSSGGTTTGVTTGHPQGEETGTYTIDGYTLTMTIDGGKTEIQSIYLPDKADTGLLVINGDNYLSDDKKK